VLSITKRRDTEKDGERERHDRSLTDKVQNCRAFRGSAGNETALFKPPRTTKGDKTSNECKKIK
jgi:hypothetical protein